MYEIEEQLKAEGFSLICGVDEAGRGPLAGPVCAAAVILDPEFCIDGLNDSKKLSEKKREALYPIIMEKALAVGVSMVDQSVIDDINILQATMGAMVGAVKALAITPDFAIIDGNKCPELECPAMEVIGGDGKSASIAAASIIAKVTRDRYMVELGQLAPEYGFEIHKGYGTPKHYEAIRTYGKTQWHRNSFLKNMK